MYQYRESGLDNIYLSSGYTVRETSQGKTVSIVNIPGLHRAIAKVLVEDKPHLSGPEFRFLRKEMDMSQKRLASLIGKTEQTIAKWESKEKVPKEADHWIRVIYTARNGSPHIEEAIDRINAMDRRMQINLELEFEEGWQTKAA